MGIRLWVFGLSFNLLAVGPPTKTHVLVVKEPTHVIANRFCPSTPPENNDGKYCVVFSRSCRMDQVITKEGVKYFRETAVLPITLQLRPNTHGGSDVSLTVEILSSAGDPKDYCLHDLKNSITGIDLLVSPSLGRKDQRALFKVVPRVDTIPSPQKDEKPVGGIMATKTLMDKARLRWVATLSLGAIRNKHSFPKSFEGKTAILRYVKGMEELEGPITLGLAKDGGFDKDDIIPYIDWKVLIDKYGQVSQVDLRLNMTVGGRPALSMESNIPSYRIDRRGGYDIEGGVCLSPREEQELKRKEELIRKSPPPKDLPPGP